MVTRTLSELAAELGGEVVGDGSVVATGALKTTPAPGSPFSFDEPLAAGDKLHEAPDRGFDDPLGAGAIGNRDKPYPYDECGNHHSAGFMRRLADGFARLKCAGRGLGLHVRHHVWIFALDEFACFGIAKDFAPRFLEAD